MQGVECDYFCQKSCFFVEKEKIRKKYVSNYQKCALCYGEIDEILLVAVGFWWNMGEG
jgi:hypothetical protein